MEYIVKTLERMFHQVEYSRLYLVGGIVRDHFLGQTNYDIDLVSDISPETLISLGFHPVHIEGLAPFYFLFHEQLGKIEVTCFKPGQTLEDELLRRDFTVNAIAMTLEGEILDPHGGTTDLKRGLLRTCSDQCFLQDPMRIFRAFRFETNGWRLSSHSEALIRKQEWEFSFEGHPIERFSNEMLKSLQAKSPDIFFRRMVEFNVGSTFLPELFRMTEIPAGPATHHPEGDLLSHSLEVLQRISGMTADLIPRFCAFFHDLGKIATTPDKYPKHIGHDEAGFSMAPHFCDRLKLSASLRKSLMYTCKLHLTAGRWHDLRDSSKIKLARQAIKGKITGFLRQTILADHALSDAMQGWETAIHAASLSSRDLGIDPDLLEGKTSLAPKDRMALIHQRQVEWFRNNSG